MIKKSRGTGKRKKVNSIDREKEFMEAFAALGKEKGISPELLLEAIKEALKKAYRSNFNSAQNVRVDLDPSTGSYHVYSIKNVAEGDVDEIYEISIEEARKINPAYEVGDTLEIEVTPANFGRIAAQTAKQIVTQKVREAERGSIFEEYSSRASDIVTGVIQRIEGKNVFIDLGRAEANLPQAEQVEGENYHMGERIKAYVIDVKKTSKSPQIIVSRTHPGLLKRLFEIEVPEIYDGIVQINSVAREPGSRSKIAVSSTDEDVDPIGACVGQKGMRVQAIVDELRDEKIDIVKWNKDPAHFIANALSPARVVSVAVNEAEKISRVVVPDYQLSLAIGKEGQNARLAAKLTGWKIDIKSETQAEEEEYDDNMDFVEVEEDESFTAEVE